MQLSFGQGSGRLVLERGFDEVDDFAKRDGVGSSEISEHLAVDLDLRGFDTFHETAVGQAEVTDGSVDTDLPEVTVIALFRFAIAVSVLAAVVNGVGRVAVKFGTFETEAFGRRQHSLTAFTGSGGIGDTHDSLFVKG